jgi:beta-glucosidase
MDVDQTLAKLNISQKIKLLCGSGWWHTEAIPEAGVPGMRMSDGPNGVRGQFCVSCGLVFSAAVTYHVY